MCTLLHGHLNCTNMSLWRMFIENVLHCRSVYGECFEVQIALCRMFLAE